jgi:hypothetical protein
LYSAATDDRNYVRQRQNVGEPHTSKRIGGLATNPKTISRQADVVQYSAATKYCKRKQVCQRRRRGFRRRVPSQMASKEQQLTRALRQRPQVSILVTIKSHPAWRGAATRQQMHWWSGGKSENHQRANGRCTAPQQITENKCASRQRRGLRRHVPRCIPKLPRGISHFASSRSSASW